MPKLDVLALRFPVGGIERRLAFAHQHPYTCYDALNVRPTDAKEGRERGGSRPGLGKAFYQDLGAEVRMLATIGVSREDGLIFWRDNFDGDALGSIWAAASWLSGAPGILPEDDAAISTAAQALGVVRAALSPTINVGNSYIVSIYIAPWNGQHHGSYSLFARMNNSTPVCTTDGVKATLNLSTTGAYTGALTVYAGGAPTVYAFAGGATGHVTGGWFRLLISSNTCKCYWLGTEVLSQAVSAAAGSRIGFGVEATNAGGVCLVDAFEVHYYTTANPSVRKDILVASASGDLFRSDPLDGQGLVQVSTPTATLASDRRLHAADCLQKLYIADMGDLKDSGTDGQRGSGNDKFDDAAGQNWTALGLDLNNDVLVIYGATGDLLDGTYRIVGTAAGEIDVSPNCATGAAGTCSYFIRRAPKIYDPETDALSVWTATTGSVPGGCHLVCVYRNRLVLAGENVWYMSRQDDPLDWDYGQTDSRRAVAGPSSDAGSLGDVLTALVPRGDDYLVFGCMSSLWVLRGDPAYGGQIDNLDRMVGILDGNAWCFGPGGELYFMSRVGLYVLAPGAPGPPMPVSKKPMPRELQEIDPLVFQVELAYDLQWKGIHVYLTPREAGATRHWWFHPETGSFWPVSLQSSHEPTAILDYRSENAGESGILLGCRDGYLRSYRETHETDEGSEIVSFVQYGPFPLGVQGWSDGILAELVGVPGRRSGDVDWALYVGESHEETAKRLTAFLSGTWSRAGLNYTSHPRARGHSCRLNLSNGEATRRWEMERLTVRRETGGRLRLG